MDRLNEYYKNELILSFSDEAHKTEVFSVKAKMAQRQNAIKDKPWNARTSILDILVPPQNWLHKPKLSTLMIRLSTSVSSNSIILSVIFVLLLALAVLHPVDSQRIVNESLSETHLLLWKVETAFGQKSYGFSLFPCNRGLN